MRYLKTFENFKLKVPNSMLVGSKYKITESIVSDDDIIDFLDKLDKLSKHYDETSEEGSSSDLRYEHKGNIITINYGWMTYEEGY